MSLASDFLENPQDFIRTHVIITGTYHGQQILHGDGMFQLIEEVGPLARLISSSEIRIFRATTCPPFLIRTMNITCQRRRLDHISC